LKKRGFEWSVFRDTLTGLQWNWLALSILCVLATYYGRALRWAILIKPVQPHARMWNLLTATVIGFAAVTLLGRPGEFVRPYLIATKERVSFSSQLAAWLLERIYDLLLALLVFAFALTRVRHSAAQVGPALTWALDFGGRAVGLLCLVCLVLLIGFRHFSEVLSRRLLDGLRILPAPKYAHAERLVHAFVRGVESTKDAKSLFMLILYTVLEWALIAGCFVCLIRAFGSSLHFGLVDVMIFMGFVSFGSVIQIPGVGGGTQVVSILVLTELFGVPLEIATSIALLAWIITFVVVVPVGALLALHEGLSWARLKDEVGREVGT
jgi:glycosyltransferase 2 family protein